MRKLLNQSGTIHTLPLLLIIAAVGIISFLLISSTAPLSGLFGTTNPKTPSHAATTGCQFLSAPSTQAAFCDTFNNPNPNPAGINTRSGQLDGEVWGASRATSNDNNTQNLWEGWNLSTNSLCGASQQVFPEGDIKICNGQFVESVSDQGSFLTLAVYPKQPFDFTGRTGTVVFDVGNDTQGSHMAWPDFVISDKPIPAPHRSAAGLGDYAQFSYGFALNEDVQNGAAIQPQVGNYGDSFTVGDMFITNNYQFQELNANPSNGTVMWQPMGNVKKAVPGGPLNHIEIKMSASGVQVWGTDPGSTKLVELAATTPAFTMPLTKGLVWMEDVHYNACKDPGTQCDHGFAWDNFGFDGPINPRDLTFDVPDNNKGATTSNNSIGYLLPITGQGVTTFQIPSVHGTANASAAYVLMTFMPHMDVDITYSLNGHPNHVFPWPFGNTADGTFFRTQSEALPVPLNEVVDGTNTLKISGNDTGFGLGTSSISNIDLLLVGAGGIPSCINPSQCAGSPTLPPSPTPSAGPTTTPRPTTTPSSAPSASPDCTKLILGDTNCDTFINLIDYSTVISHFGQNVPKNTLGDVNGSGTVDLLDYSTVVAHFGQ